MRIKISINDLEFEATVYENEGGVAFSASLPLEVSMSRWGDEYYGSIPTEINEDDNSRDILEIGEIAFWPPGNAFCIFFGPTPMSEGDEPRAASDVVPLGIIDGGDDLSELKSLGGMIKATIDIL
jgi:hypothetical protein